MQTLIKWKRSVVVAFTATALPVLAVAAPTTLAGVGEFAVNGQIGTWISNTLTLNNNETVRSVGTHTFSGMDGSGNQAEMSLQYAAQAQSGTAGLKVQASATLSTPFYNAGNIAYLDDRLAGVPAGMSVDAQAMMQDRLAVAGQGLAYVTASIHLDGSNMGLFDDGLVTGKAYSYVNDAGGALFNSTTSPSAQSYDLTLTTHRFAVTNGGIDFYLNLAASVAFDQLGDSQADYTGFVDFFNTLTIVGFSGWDAAGNAVELTKVTGSDGFVYLAPPPAPNGIPEPSNLALTAIATGMLVAAMKRRRVRAGSPFESQRRSANLS